jgi:hypothetical protein
MDEKEYFAKLKRIAGDTSDMQWDGDSLGGFFLKFRPDGKGVEEVLEGVEMGDEILNRLLLFYEATSPGKPEDFYFKVKDLPAISSDEAKRLVTEYLEKMAEFAREDDTGSSDAKRMVKLLRKFLKRTPNIKVTEGQAPRRQEDEESDLGALIPYVISDLIIEADAVESLAMQLEEGLYSMAADYNISGFILWPLYRDCFDTEDPFASYFEMWKHGITIDVPDNKHVVAYIPEGKLLP